MEGDQKTIWGMVFPTTDVTGIEGWEQHLFDMGAEDLGVDPSPWLLVPVA